MTSSYREIVRFFPPLFPVASMCTYPLLPPETASQFPQPTPSRHLSTFPQAFQIYTVTNTRSTFKVLWQDGTVTSGPSSSFEQVHVLDDETEVFPGDLGMFSGSTPERCGVVQSMDNRKRTIKLRFLDNDNQGEEEVVSAMEFDPHGPPTHEYGVRRGDWVLLAKEEEGNGVEPPEVPSLGESETAAGLMAAGEELRYEVSENRRFPRPSEYRLKPFRLLGLVVIYGIVVRSKLTRFIPPTSSPNVSGSSLFDKVVRRSLGPPPRWTSPRSIPGWNEGEVPSQEVVPFG